MENDAAILYCPNDSCHSPNPLTHNFCQQCRTPLPKRYLWAVGDGLSSTSTGEILAERYLVISQSIVLDTKPGLLPQTPESENLQSIRPYLRLISYRLYVPQIYGMLTLTNGKSHQEVLLLEKPPLDTDDTAKEVQLGSELAHAWSSATSMRQLNWLWQIAYLWQPLASEGVVSSLLNRRLLRVEGSLVRLLELQQDANTPPELCQLGELWEQLLPQAKPAIAEFMTAICRFLIQGKINSGEQLVAVLDKALAEIGQSQISKIQIAAKSDTGPSRQRNEDACYPHSGNTITKPPQSTALAIVCDGIGGHEGGNVASNLAIETIQQQVQHLSNVTLDHIHPATLLEDLEQAAAVANDKISQINDNEHRQGRQRMGTTLVMALPIAHEMYIAHVGDSRAYWITRHGCYQVTLDDDVASREVRLGYTTYREAVQQGASGSLVQALGMSASSSLHPTTQRFILDEDCVFLLCSDGLSDFDRVEQYWDTEILPILNQQLDVLSVTENLIEIANNQNGHDNVTIALMYCQIQYGEPESTLSPSLAEPSGTLFTDLPFKTSQTTRNLKSAQTTQVITPRKSSKSLMILPLQLVSLIILIFAGVLLGHFLRVRLPWDKIFSGTTPSVTPVPSVTTTSNLENTAVVPGQLIKTKSEMELSRVTTSSTDVIAPAGSILEVIQIESPPTSASGDFRRVALRVCSVGKATASVPGNKLVKQGDEGKILLSKLNSSQYFTLKGKSTSQCTASNTLPIETQSAPPQPTAKPKL
jgi:protein phosphatase